MKRTAEKQTTSGGNIRKTKKPVTNIDFEMRSPVLRRILIAVGVILFTAFCVYQVAVYTGSRTTLKTSTALARTITKSINVNGIVVREEQLLPSTVGAGTLVPRVENGGKVSSGDPVATVFTAASDAQKLMELDAVEADIAYYESIAGLSAANIYENKDAYNQNISRSLFSLLDCIGANELGELPDRVSELSLNVTKRQIAVGAEVDVDGTLETLYARAEGLRAGISSGTVIRADRAGYYVSTADGYENAEAYAEALNAMPEDVQNMMSASPAAVPAATGKLITQFNWYYLCTVSKAEAEAVSVDQRFDIVFSGYAEGPVSMYLVKKNKTEDGDRVVLVFRSNLMNAGLASLRLEEAKITLESYSGYAIDPNALRQRKEDGAWGVYVQLGSLVKFRQVKIIYQDESVAISESVPNDGYLRLYDEIILEGVDLRDDKIIT